MKIFLSQEEYCPNEKAHQSGSEHLVYFSNNGLYILENRSNRYAISNDQELNNESYFEICYYL